MRRVPSVPVLLLLASCGSDGTPGSAVTCSAVPSCYTDALSALEACVTESALSLGSVTINSGVVQGLQCSGTNTTVLFSDFSANENGTVPLPSNTAISTGGSECVTIGSITGFTQDSSGMRLDFVGTTIEIPGQGEVTVREVENGGYTLLCGTEEFDVGPGTLDTCPGVVKTHTVVRDTGITQMSVQLTDASGTASDLFVCN